MFCCFKVKALKFACERKDEALGELDSEKKHLEGEMVQQTHTHNKHKAQMEQHYQLMLDDLKDKVEQQLSWNKEADEKTATLDRIRAEQEIEIGELKQLLVKFVSLCQQLLELFCDFYMAYRSQNNAQGFQVALCLLSSVLWPALERLSMLVSQQQMLWKSYRRAEQTNAEIAQLVSALSNDPLQSYDGMSFSNNYCRCQIK